MGWQPLESYAMDRKRVQVRNLKSYADECLERAERATPGPWDRNPHNSCYPSTVVTNNSRLTVARCDSTQDIDFIARARTDVPELARRLKRACEWLRGRAESEAAMAGPLGPFGESYRKLASELESLPRSGYDASTST